MMDYTWTIEVQGSDGSWRQLCDSSRAGWRYVSREEAERELAYPLTRRFLYGRVVRTAPIRDGVR